MMATSSHTFALSFLATISYLSTFSSFTNATPTVTKRIDTTFTVVEPKYALSKRAPVTNCDGRNILFCPTGTCYSGGGYIGCCTVSNCAYRTICVPSKSLTAGALNCNPDHGGCIPCTDPAAPSCVTIFNKLEDYSAMYCDSTGGYFPTSYRYVRGISLSIAQLPMTTLPVQTSTETVPGPESTKTVVSTIPSSLQTGTSTTDSPAATATPSDGDHNAGISKGALAGIVIGSVAVITLIAAMWFVRRRSRKATNRSTTTAPSTGNGYDSIAGMPYMYSNLGVQSSQPQNPSAGGTHWYGAEKSEISGRTSPKEVHDTPSSKQTRFGQSPQISEMSDTSPRLNSFPTDANSQQPQHLNKSAASNQETTAPTDNQGVKPVYKPYRPPEITSNPTVGYSTATGWKGYKHLSAEDALKEGWKDDTADNRSNGR